MADRPEPTKPPAQIAEDEVRYVTQLQEAYADSNDITVDEFDLEKFPELERHFHRQRESFYFAESLKNFARDSVPPGTYDELQKDMLSGVIDVAEDDYEDGLARLKEVTKASKFVPLDANGLFQVIRIRDRFGICHQLANVDELTWVRK